MDRTEKVAYYYSELGGRSNDCQATGNGLDNKSSLSNNNNNGINNGNESDVLDKTNDSNKMHNQNLDPRSDFQSNEIGNRMGVANRPIHNQMEQASSEQEGRRLAQNSVIVNHHQQQSLNSSQPQYLISNSNPQHSTNLTPQHFSQQHGITNNNLPLQSQIHSNGSYHVNQNHRLYQPNLPLQPKQQQTQQQIQRQHGPNPLIQHHKSPSMTDEGQMRVQNQVIFHNANKQQQQQILTEQGDLQRRQMPVQHQSGSSNEAVITSSQSMTQNDFSRIRRKPDQMGIGLTSEVGIESLNLNLEAMLMSDVHDGVNSNQFATRQQVNQNDRLMRSMQNIVVGDKPGTMNEMSSNCYGQPGQVDPNIHGKDSPFNTHNRSEDNIYEEIDMTMSKYQAEYPVDSISLHSDTWKKKNGKKFLGASFTRWFSTRKKSSNSQNSDQEENIYIDSKSIKKPRLISLPDTVPDNLTPEKLKRRLIVGSIVDSENSYTNSLYRLIYEYKKPLEESDPPILSSNKIGIIFFQLDQILQFHKLFGFSLSHHVQEWDEKEMIGSVFTKSFSQLMVLDIYSGFINNFTNAMETARRASKSRAFAQFLQDKSKSSPDRLSFFGSMVKPVQRFPQFILLLSDLLKHTPANHPDRMPLQRALTELESLADRLNERKRDAERHFAVKQLLKDHLNDSNTHAQRFLLRQDDTCLLDMDPTTNTILKSKNRKMYLLNDMFICVSNPSNRLKFAVPLSDITVIEGVTPAIGTLLAHSNFRNLNDNLNSSTTPQNYTVERMECERQSLVHDLEIMMRISAMVASLRFQYNGLNPVAPEQICMGIRDEIRKKEFQMTLIDRSCLQIRLHSKNNKDTLVVQFCTPESKRDWLIDFRLTKLALDRANNPGWENVTDNPPPRHQASLCSIGQRVPLFVKSLAIFKSDMSHLTCALHYYLRQAPFIGENPAGVLWICNVSVGSSSLGALATNGAEVSLIHSYELSESHVTCLEAVGSTLWIGLRQGRIIVIDANSPGEWVQFASLDVQAEVTCIKHFGRFVYVGLVSGVVAVFDAINFEKPHLIQLSQSPVTCLMPINEEVFACSHNKIWRINETTVQDSLVVQNQQHGDNIIPLEEEPHPNLLAHCGNGIWVSLIDSPIVKLYHAETLKHLVDINVGTSIKRVLNDLNDEIKVTVTSMMTTRGLLWIGTNVGMIATLMLPRLQGVPLVSGSINVALHRFLGPVNILLNLSAGSECIPQLPFNNRQNPHVRQNATKNEDAEAIYGQYADLMNVGDYITTSRKSGHLGEATIDRMGWDFPNVNISSMNISDDSGSNASSGAIYQDGLPRGMKQVPNRAVISNHLAGGSQQHQSAAMANQQIISNPNNMVQPQAQTMQLNQLSDLNHVYDRSQTQSITYATGSLNGVGGQQQMMSGEGVSLDRRQMLSASQNQLAQGKVSTDTATTTPGSQADYSSQLSSRAPSKLYDQPGQLVQQQQVNQQQQQQQQQQATVQQGLNQIDGGVAGGMQAPPASNYGAIGSSGILNNTTGPMIKSGFTAANKTVLVLAGGNGYQRMALGDNKPFGEHAHCIVWEYKA